jgi:phosphate transport system substrate-binding protein
MNAKRLIMLVLAVTAVSLHPGFAPSAPAQMLINGAGATFPNPLYSKWTDEYTRVDPSVHINYQSIGSGGGKRQLVEQTVDFGASDVPMRDDEMSKAPGKILHIPTVAGAVVITYNLEGNPQLKLDGDVIADIFLGKITQWNDPRIARLNPGVKLPSVDIIIAHRADGSGTTGIFTAYLSAISAEWRGKVGSDTSVKWPTGLGGKGNEGVSGLVKQSPGAIGYVELIYALQNKLAMADVKNASGKYVTPSLQSVTAAMATAQVPDDLRFMIINPPGDESYPIGGCTYLLVYEDLKSHLKDPSHGAKLVEFLKWAETDGQKMAAPLDYAPLPAALQKRALEIIGTIKY